MPIQAGALHASSLPDLDWEQAGLSSDSQLPRGIPHYDSLEHLQPTASVEHSWNADKHLRVQIYSSVGLDATTQLSEVLAARVAEMWDISVS